MRKDEDLNWNGMRTSSSFDHFDDRASAALFDLRVRSGQSGVPVGAYEVNLWSHQVGGSSRRFLVVELPVGANYHYSNLTKNPNQFKRINS